MSHYDNSNSTCLFIQIKQKKKRLILTLLQILVNIFKKKKFSLAQKIIFF